MDAGLIDIARGTRLTEVTETARHTKPTTTTNATINATAGRLPCAEMVHQTTSIGAFCPALPINRG